MNCLVVSKLGKKKKEQGAMNAKRITVGKKSKWNFPNGLGTLSGQSISSFSCGRNSYLHSVEKQLTVSVKEQCWISGVESSPLRGAVLRPVHCVTCTALTTGD